MSHTSESTDRGSVSSTIAASNDVPLTLKPTAEGYVVIKASKITRRGFSFTICTLLVCAHYGGVALADGTIRDGLGARVAGRGGTNIAFADAGTILHDNPAGMVNLPTLQTDLVKVISENLTFDVR